MYFFSVVMGLGDSSAVLASLILRIISGTGPSLLTEQKATKKDA